MPQYPRKRISVACHYCRHRKRRCDGHRPQCALCRESDVACEYPKQIVEEVPKRGNLSQNQRTLLNRLDRLETLLRGNSKEADQVIDSENNKTAARRDFDAEAYGGDERGEASTRETNEELANAEETFANDEDEDQTRHLEERLNRLLESHDSIQTVFPVPLNNNSAITPDSSIWHASSPNTGQLACLLPESLNVPEPDDGMLNDQPFSIPDDHLTTTDSLFSLGPIKKLIGEYPTNLFYHVESTRGEYFQNDLDSLNVALSDLDLRTEKIQMLLVAFFMEIHIHFPILNPESFEVFFHNVMNHNPRRSLEMALCLIVLALGQLAVGSEEDGSIHKDPSKNGMHYFTIAHEMMNSNTWSHFGDDTVLPTGLLLSAVYLSYMTYPLLSWHLAYTASIKLQLIVSHTRQDLLSAEQKESVERLCWACFIIECDTLAEFHLPKSGIENIVHQMQFPHCQQRSTQEGLLFLSLCSIRSLLNRIHHAIYAASEAIQSSEHGTDGNNSATTSSPSNIPISNMEGVIKELLRQLETWYSSLPGEIKPPLDPQKPCGRVQQWLRSRYWSARHIITRPCLLELAAAPDNSSPLDFVLVNSQICIESCRNFIKNAAAAVQKPSQYTWMMIQASVSCIMVLTIASRNISLQHLTSDLDGMLSQVITMARKWGTPNSSIELVHWILSTIQKRRRLNMC